MVSVIRARTRRRRHVGACEAVRRRVQERVTVTERGIERHAESLMPALQPTR